MKSPYRIPIIHSIESRHFVNAHWGHLENPSDFIHNADTCEAMLSLAEIKKGHYGGFFVLRWISFEDLGDELLVNVIEGERY